MTRRDSGRRYAKRFGISMLAYVVLLPLGIMAANALPDGSPLRYAAVLLPLPAVLAVAWSLWRLVVEADEFQAKLLLESLGIAVAGTGVCAFAYGMLQIAGLPPLPWVWVTALLMAWFGIGALITNLRYRG